MDSVKSITGSCLSQVVKERSEAVECTPEGGSFLKKQI
jgi:hypothetical protein